MKTLKMLKAQIVIRYFIFLIIHFGFSQSDITGTYVGEYIPSEYSKKVYKLYQNGQFDFMQGESFFYGTGHYKIKKDSLILNFDLTRLSENSYHRFKIYKNSSDSVQLKISVFDLDKKPLSRVNVYNLKSKYGTIVNDQGIAYLKFKKNLGNLKIEASDIDYVGHSFLVDSRYNYEVEVFLRKIPNGVAIKNEIEKFKILKQANNYLILLDEENNQIEWSRLDDK